MNVQSTGANLLRPFLIGIMALSYLAHAASPDQTSDARAQDQFDDLIALTQQQGRIPVIVQLAVEGPMPSAAMSATTFPTQAPEHRAAMLEQRQRNTAQAQSQFAARIGATSSDLKRFRYLPLAAMTADRQQLEELRKMPAVVGIQQDHAHFINLDSSLPVVGANNAHALGWDGLDQVVAILDTGVDSSHPMLANTIIADAAACFSGTNNPEATSFCNTAIAACTDADGETIDRSACGVGAAEPCSNGRCGHGTHVAGIAAGNGTFTGVAPAAGIIPIQIFVEHDYDGDGYIDLVAYDSDIILGLEHVLALSQHLDIAATNLSIGGDLFFSTAHCDSVNSAVKYAIDQLREVGIATVISAGNNNSSNGITAPGCISTSVSVGSTTDYDELSWFSNESPALTLHAPGSDIISAIPGGDFGSASGTSMAAPHVTGAMALLKQKAAALEVEIEVNHLVSALQQTGAEISYGLFQVPRIQVDAALDEIDQTPPLTIILDNELNRDSMDVLSGSLSEVATVFAYGGAADQGIEPAQNIVRFTPDVPTAGIYRVSAIWPVQIENGSAIRVSIAHEQGVDVQYIDQTDEDGAGLWHELGSYQFAAGTQAYVEFSDELGGHVIADAVRFEHGAAPIQIATSTLPGGNVGTAYNAQLQATGGVPPYSWSILSGSLPAGLALQNSSGEVSGMPTVATEQTFTVSVIDNLGIAVSRAFSIRIIDDTRLLLEEDFANGIPADWTIIDQGAMDAPSAWTVNDGVLSQSSNIYGGVVNASSLPKPGTYLRYDAGTVWSDYTLSLALRSDDDDALGVMFRLADNNHYYRFSWDRQRGYRRLVKNVGGKFTLLAQDSAQYTQGQTYQLEIRAQRDLIEVRIDGVLIFSVHDNSIAQGSIALYSWGNEATFVDDIRVVRIFETANNVPILANLTATPAIISDRETTRLSVYAIDPDYGPNPDLTYQWTIPPDSGTLDDPFSATPIFTPTDVSSNTDYQFEVEVYDGESVISGSMDMTIIDAGITSGQLLLQEHFDTGMPAGWSIVDEGTQDAPSSWTANAGLLQQLSNLYGGLAGTSAGFQLPKPGTYLYYEAGTAWRHYTTHLSLRSDDDDALGLMFRMVDANNYYRFSWDKQRGYRRLVKKVGGTFSLLAQDEVVYETGRTYQLDVLAQNDLIEVRIDGEVVFSVQDASLAHGSIATYSWGNVGAVFDDIIVEAM